MGNIFSCGLLCLMCSHHAYNFFFTLPHLQVIIVLSSVNLLMPTVVLYMLSMSDYGRHLERVVPIKVFDQMVHLLAINIPFLGVRIYLW